MGKKDSEKAKEEPNHTGSVVPEDEELTRWLNRLWARNEPPERIEVWQVFGKEKRDRGELIFHEDFVAGSKRNPEQSNHLANEIIAAAQNDCDSTPKRRESYFQIAVIDKNRRSVPLVRRLGPLRPQRNLGIVRASDSTDDEIGMDDEELSVRALEHARLKTGFDEIRWQSNRNDRVLGELLLFMRDVTQELVTEGRSLRAENREIRTHWNDAEDRRVMRDVQVRREQFKIDLMEEGVRAGRNLLPGLFAAARDTNGGGGQHSNGHNEASGNSNSTAPHYDASTERTLVDNFLHDCEKKNLLEKLFGEAEEKDGKPILTKPGIFTPHQAKIFIGVRGGYLPPKALWPLMPGSGDPIAITMEQISKAMEAGVTDGIGTALIELKEVCKRAQEAEAAAAAPTTNGTTDKK